MNCLCSKCKFSLTEQDKNSHIDTYESRLEESWTEENREKQANAGFLDALQMAVAELPTISPQDMAVKSHSLMWTLTTQLSHSDYHQIGAEGFEYMQNECKSFFATFGTAFEQRHTEPLWWNRVAEFFCGIAHSLSPIQMRTFFTTQRLEWLVAGLADLQTAAPEDRKQTLHTLDSILIALGTSVEVSPKIASQLRLLGIGKALSAVAHQLRDGDHHHSKSIGFCVSRYIGALCNMSLVPDEGVVPAAISILRLDPGKHWDAIDGIIIRMVELINYSHDNKELIDGYLQALADLLGNLTFKLQSKWSDLFAESMLDFIGGVLVLAEHYCTVINPLFWKLLQNKNWNLICLALLKQFQNGSECEVLQEIGAKLSRLWVSILHCPILIPKLAVSLETFQLLIYLAHTNSQEHLAHHFLDVYFLNVDIEELKWLLDENKEVLADFSSISDKANTEITQKNIAKLKEAVMMREKFDEFKEVMFKRVKDFKCPYADKDRSLDDEFAEIKIEKIPAVKQQFSS